MMKNHHLAHKIASQSWYELRRQLTYKCAWYGKELIVVPARNTSRVSNMMKNHHLAHKIASQSWYELRRQLTYKCAWYGKELIVVPARNTSRICSQCGLKNTQFDQLTTNEWLAVRHYV